MSVKRWALSVFFVWHLVAISVASLESPGGVPRIGPPRHPHNDVIAAGMTPVLDRVAFVLSQNFRKFDRAIGPVRRLTTYYLNVTGVNQSWKMFSTPPEVYQYLRVRYYIGAGAADAGAGARPTWTATELLLPAHREDRVRVVRGYWDAYRDKAMTSALSRFQGHRSDRLIKADTKSSELPDDLAPIGRYFARRFERQSLVPGERILRTEIWYGIAGMALPGYSLDRERMEARFSVLRPYYDGPVENHFDIPAYPGYRSYENEGDIRWFLEYFE